MIRSYFKIAWRNLWKNKLFSFIYIMGLGLAIPFALLSLIQVVNVYEYDNFHPHPDRTYRIITDVTDANGNKIKYAATPFALARTLKTDYPFVEQSTNVIGEMGWELTNRIKTIRVNVLFTEPSFFDIFGFYLEKGTLPVAPNSIVLTHEKAEIFFGDADPVGKTLSHHDYGELKVTGVLKPFKKNTHLKTDAMISMATYERMHRNVSKTDLPGYTYVLLKENTKIGNLDAAINTLAANSNKENAEAKQTIQFRRQKLSKISPAFEELRGNMGVESVLELSVNLAIAMAIILLAGFNYTNLTLARSLSRAKEVGIRKVSGALRHQLIGQFICEAILIALLSLVTGFVVLRFMQQFVHVNWITWEVDNQFILWVVFILFAILIGVLAGIIPARILSRFQPVKVLKGAVSPASFGKINFRKSLVVIQFVVTACFIFLIANLYSQFKYMATDNENFNRRNIYNVSANGNYKLLKNDISNNKDVERVGLVSTPFGGTSATCTVKNDQQGNNSSASYYAANADFIANMNLQFVAGKNLPESNSDSASNFVVVNEQALFALGLGTPREAISKKIILNDSKEVIINGVVKDFCYFLYQFRVSPLIMQYNPAQFHVLSIKTKSAVAEQPFKAKMQAIWKKYNPYEELAFSNYEKEVYERYYPGADMKFMGMVCFIIFVIAIMGLIGMVTYNTEKRVKEIGIRKVMGASVVTIVKELSAGFVKLILIAASICIPLGYVAGYFFINLFAFNNGVNIGLMIFLFCLIFFIALFTIAIKTIGSASVNPVKSLRTE
ncbi:ABC transporter permease [Terrimonas alba]|uniref:ABC transporter permease n=1 Tax=Terrimonas alba TaxID=3349636 RepID=UPI0035F46D3B